MNSDVLKFIDYKLEVFEIKLISQVLRHKIKFWIKPKSHPVCFRQLFYAFWALVINFGTWKALFDNWPRFSSFQKFIWMGRTTQKNSKKRGRQCQNKWKVFTKTGGTRYWDQTSEVRKRSALISFCKVVHPDPGYLLVQFKFWNILTNIIRIRCENCGVGCGQLTLILRK